jgi:hypothetical protein
MQGSPLFDSMHPCSPNGTSQSALRNIPQVDDRDYWREIGWFAPHEEDGLDGYLFAEDAELRISNS